MGLFIDLIKSYQNNKALATSTAQNSMFGSHEPKTPASGRVRVEVLEALNGRVLEVNTRANENADWETDLYIVRDDEVLSDAIAAVLIVGRAK